MQEDTVSREEEEEEKEETFAEAELDGIFSAGGDNGAGAGAIVSVRIVDGVTIIVLAAATDAAEKGELFPSTTHQRGRRVRSGNCCRNDTKSTCPVHGLPFNIMESRSMSVLRTRSTFCTVPAPP